MSRYLDKTIAGGLLVLAVFSALAHGAVEPWSGAIFSWMIILLIAVWAVKAVIDRNLSLRIPLITLPLAGLLVLGLIQGLAFGGGDGQMISLSYDFESTRATTLKLFLLIAAFIIAVNTWKGAARLNFLAWFLTSYGLAMAVFGIVQHYSWNGHFYWIRPMGNLTSPFGPFMNHGLFAGYMILLLAIPAGLAMRRGVNGPARYFCAFAAAIMGLAIIISLSRGGMISLAGALLALAIFSFLSLKSGRDRYSRERGRRFPLLVSQFITVALIIAAITLSLVWLGPEPVINRITEGELIGSGMQQNTFFNNRGWIWKDTLTMIRANPLTGVGLGAYTTAYPIYSHSDGTLKVEEAHNDYLQIMADGGLVGGLLALSFIVLMLRTIMTAIRSSDPFLSGLAVGCGTGIIGLFIHSFLDFNLQIPSTALMFLLLSAVTSVVAETVTQPETGLAHAIQDSDISEIGSGDFVEGGMVVPSGASRRS